VSPSGVTFQYFYEGLYSPTVEGLNPSTNLPNPQLTARVINATGNTGPYQFDLSLVTWSDTAKFNLARLDTVSTVNKGITGIRNVAIEGDLLPTVTLAAQKFFNLSSTQGGVRLPQDQLAGVEVRDHAQAGLVQAMSIQGLAFGSLTVGTTTQTGAASNQAYASQLLASGTAIVQAGTLSYLNAPNQETFRVPFDNGQGQTVAVALFLDDNKNGVLDNSSLNFIDQDQFVTTGDPRGTVTALVAVNGPALTGSTSSMIQTLALAGDGGSFATKLPIAAVTSTGPLGDLSFQGTQGITGNVTAPSIFGNIASSGPIAGIIQTDGRWTNMTTGQQSSIAADFGRTITDTNGNVLSVTTISAQGGGITGQIISRGNLISQITAGSGISGVIAAQGDLGVIQYNSISKKPVRFGGIQSIGTISGQIVTLGNIFGDINITSGGNLTGRIAANGRPLSNSLYPANLGLPSTATGILGNITISGALGTSKVQGAIVSRGEIGDSTLGTALNLTQAGAVNGILAAEGPINVVNPLSSSSTFFIFNNASTTDPISAAAVDAIFEDSKGQPLSFDQTSLDDLKGLAVIETNLKNLHVGKNGKLTIVPGA
jgi:hypothetical protein